MFSFSETRYKIPGKNGFCFPRMSRVRQEFPRPRIDDVTEVVSREFKRIGVKNLEGNSIAITAGSRGIPNLPEILRALGSLLREAGARPFVVPSMGSHGNASASGQKEVLRRLGITDKSVGMEIRSSMETECIGYVRGKVPIYFDRQALAADGIIVCGRIKPHTDYRGEIESGICKMMTIGLGNHKGASTLHHQGQQEFSWLIQEGAEICLEKAPVLFGIGILDNAYHETAKIIFLRPAEIVEKEKSLLVEARKLMARLHFRNLDVLVVDSIGKEISGAGMDPNVIGRTVTGSSGFDDIRIKRIAVLGLSPLSKGHASGLSMSDVTTLEVAKSVDFAKTYTNSIASSCPEGGRLPMVLNNDLDALIVAIWSSHCIPACNARIVQISNTTDLEEIRVSKTLLPEVLGNPKCRILSDPELPKFYKKVHLKPVYERTKILKKGNCV